MRSLLISLNHFSLFFELLVQCLHLHIFNTYFFSLKSTKNKNAYKFEMILHVWPKNYFVLTVQSLKPYSSVTNISKLSWLLTSELLTETYICMRNFVVVFFLLVATDDDIFCEHRQHITITNTFFHLVQQFIVNKSRHTNMDFLFLVGD